MSIVISTAEGDNLATALAADIGANSMLEIRTGVAPGPDNAATGTLLVSITLTGTFSAAGLTVTGPDPLGVNPAAAGVAGYFRLKTSGGTAVLEGSISGIGQGGDLELTSTDIALGVAVNLGAPTFTIPLS